MTKGWRRLPLRGQNFDRVGEAGDRLGPEGAWRGIEMLRNSGSQEDWLGESLAQAFHAAGEVDGVADNREIQPVGAAHIAIGDGAEVQGGPEVDGFLAGLGAGPVEGAERLPGVDNGSQCLLAASGGVIVLIDWKDRENAVAEKLQNIPPFVW